MKKTKKTALVTGGGRGIGLGISKCLLQEGYKLAFCGVKPGGAVSDVVKELGKLGHTKYVQCDISQGAQRLAMIDAVEDKFGPIHLLVNNAGVAPAIRADILEAEESSFDRLISINLKGPYFLTQAVANRMLSYKKENEAFDAKIVNITSISTETASPSRGDYCISKAGLGMVTKLWAVRLAEFGIPVYEVRPGIVKTDMTAAVTDKYDKLIHEEGLLPQARWGTPEDVGKAVTLLARGELPYSTGQVLHVDGGFRMSRL